MNSFGISWDLVEAGLQQGLLLSFIAFGLAIPFRGLRFSDLSAEGSYPLGGAVTAALLLLGTPPLLATLGAGVAGGLAGLWTAWIHLRWRLPSLLAGILTSTMLYSLNLRLLGTANVGLFQVSGLPFWTALVALGIFWIGFLIFLKTERGLQFTAVGLNPQVAERLGISSSFWIACGLFGGNFLAGLAGSWMVQTQHYVDIGMGVGILIHGLVALLLGESILGWILPFRPFPSMPALIAPLVGGLLYPQIQSFVLLLGLAPSDLKLLTGLFLLLLMIRKKENLALRF